MPLYNLENTISKIASDRGVALYGSHKDAIRSVRKKLEKGEITSEEAIEKLKRVQDFRLKFDRDDFRTIEREMK